LEQAAVACRNALFLTDPYVDRESLISAKGTRVPGTCEWITHDVNYRAWLYGDGNDDGNGETRLLWISGGPGKGKTMLSVFLTEELERHAANRKDTRLVFFFCGAQDKKRNTTVAVLRGLVHQIIAKRPQLVKHALPYFETPERTQQTLSSLETLWIIFSKLVADAELGTMFCVLDGLDECDQGTLAILVPKLVHLLGPQALSASATTMFRLAIVSRHMQGLQRCARVRLDPDNDNKVAVDIERFISTRVRELSSIEGFNDELRSAVQAILRERAEGTFLWVGFAMHELLQKQTCSQVLDALNTLPSGLPAIYSRILLQTPNERRKTSSSILRWVAMAWRPLHLGELAAAIGIKPPSSAITTERAICDEIVLCGPLLKVQEGEVGFVHQSVRDYLLRKECDSNPVLEAFRIQQEIAHLELARRCFDCVTQSSLHTAPLTFGTEAFSHDSSFLRYAVLSWPYHARSCLALATELFKPSEAFFQTNSILRKHWWTTYLQADKHLQNRDPFPTASMLPIFCYLGIAPWVRAILTQRRWLLPLYKPRYQKIQDEQLALTSAIGRGHEAVVQVLIDCKVHVNLKNSQMQEALCLAAFVGNDVIVRALFKCGADIEAKYFDETPLIIAAKYRCNAVVQVLLNNGANVYDFDSEGQTALHWAAWQGNHAVVQMLLQKGANVNARTNEKLTALHKAVSRGHEATVRILIDSSADVMLQDNDGETALHKAVWGRYEAIVQILAYYSRDIDARDSYGQTALQRAAQDGQEVIVKTLIKNGADVRVKSNRGETMLHSAASGGNKAVVQLFIDEGVDVRAEEEAGYTALHFAAAGGYGSESVMRVLVDNGAHIEAKDYEGRTALHLAVSLSCGQDIGPESNRDTEADVKANKSSNWTPRHITTRREQMDRVLKIYARLLEHSKGLSERQTFRKMRVPQVATTKALLDFGASVESKDNHGFTALHYAASLGREAVVRLLVSKGNPETKSTGGFTALHLAVMGGHGGVIQYLVRSKVDVEARNDAGCTAVHMAAISGFELGVKMLAASGADLNTRDDFGLTLLYDAVQGGHKNVVKVLLDNKVDVNARFGNQLTALHQAALIGCGEIVRLLVEGGVDIEAENEERMTALHYAAQEGDEAVLQALVDSGANLEARGVSGFTALHISALFGHREAMQLLVDSGADERAQCNNGLTALQVAAVQGHKTFVRLFIRRGITNMANRVLRLCKSMKMGCFCAIFAALWLLSMHRGNVGL
jgi:ankyrin repeat protein